MNNLKKIVTVRHGDYHLKSLTPLGIKQSERLAQSIYESTRDLSKIQIFTSPLTRAKETADIIASGLGNPGVVEVHELEFDKYHSGEKILSALSEHIEDDTELVVAVTHFESASGVANAFLSEKLNKAVRCEAIGKGTGFLCCMQTGNFSKI